MKLFYAGNMRFAEIMINKNTSEAAKERMIARRIRNNNFSHVGVLAEVIDPTGRYGKTGQDTKVTVIVHGHRVRITNSDTQTNPDVPEGFQAMVKNMFGSRPAAEKCDMETVLVRHMCEACKRPYEEYVYREVAEFSVREDRCGFNNFRDTFQVPLENISIIVAPSLAEVMTVESGRRAVSAVFKDNQVVVTAAEKDSMIYTFATSFAFDGFNVIFTDMEL